MNATVIQGQHRCGFCAHPGNHDRCPSGIRNGNGSIILCGCGCEQSKQTRCTECGNRDAQDIGPDWRCLDKDGCAGRIAKSLDENATIQQLRSIRADLLASQAVPLDEGGSRALTHRRATRGRPAGSGTPGRAPTGQCLCCGEPTKGGKFLPGHDSKYLTRLVSTPGPESEALAATISPAFLGKYNKRIGDTK